MPTWYQAGSSIPHHFKECFSTTLKVVGDGRPNNGPVKGPSRIVKEVRKMKLDEHLITGILLGVIVGLFFTEGLAPYTALFVLGGILMVLRYLHAK
ncbi:MAG: hypothetical protein A3G87_05305 [Omnitrophica bacterium RIFCSPLOWO2_12_FULL_50_11]|nr:MAG: hypothetical protein A3G87_05305 [Omnitrophica bacterium RIFCSPLOWO2_12_FULL_50_11]